ncbi:XdhC family protein [Alteribacillus iranensis]|uniref:Xanthine and CO dehydrogenase maturation factor, XdhC/CoxF family n=1 Tax=Alteribacillus iranensis TaxID=930128 RepID=A0A1I2BBP1_9BACI|nr:XdhC/CoxI family protein [Alteribacillus iranensis]SFE52713.1 Xanthine and CO dehydrogenase maturation factor, XdhC/CoxF family [Alteribacillus iranensis]
MVEEQKRVFEAIRKAQVENKKSVLVTVVEVSGSAYRREGAKMLVDESGKTTGMISGGCLESDVAEVAKEVLETGKSVLKTYVMDEDLVWGLGLGCPGTVHLFMELVPAEEEAFSAWINAIETDQEGMMATVVEESQSSRRLFVPKKDGNSVGTIQDSYLEQQIKDTVAKKFAERNPKSETVPYKDEAGNQVDVFLDVYQPPIPLLIFGAGHDAIPVARYAVSLGMKTTVIDQRLYYNSEERFPGTNRIIASPSQFADNVHIDDRTYVIVMNHHIERDRDTLKFVLPSDACYVGVLGPRKRRVKMLEAIKEEGIEFSSSQLARMYNPIGLDIGASTPEEIAISMMSEIIAIQKGHTGGFLQGAEHIHEAQNA